MRRNQPYLPLYIQDFLTDEKLALCSAESTGVYIRVMCLMHKSERYGTILLKQKFKQSDKQVENFATQLAKFLPWDLSVIRQGLEELIAENVLQVEGDFLLQKRMVKDGEISEKRAVSGSKGGKETTKNFAKAKNQANAENESEYEITTNKGVDENEKLYQSFIEHLNTKTGKSYRASTTEYRKKFFARLKDKIPFEKILYAIDRACEDKFNIENKFQYVTPEYICREKVLDRFINQEPKEVTVTSHPYSEAQVTEIRKRLAMDGSFPPWFDDKYKHLLNYQTLIGTVRRREE